MPSIAGAVIPEAVSTTRIMTANFPESAERESLRLDTKHLLNHFLNSRGAIARFDCGAVEIRLADIQNAPMRTSLSRNWKRRRSGAR